MPTKLQLQSPILRNGMRVKDLNLMLSLLVNTVPSFLSFLTRFHLGRNRINFDPLHRCGEIVVERKGVVCAYVPTWRVFFQDLKLGACQ
jgi:hypothetical protein